MLAGLALAQDGTPTPQPTGTGDASSFVPDTPPSTLPPEGRVIGPTPAPQWIVDLQGRSISGGVATDDLVIFKPAPPKPSTAATSSTPSPSPTPPLR
ncbi:MAG: hypothetical protein R2873_10245 [Caldilineaceae bacterium]